MARLRLVKPQVSNLAPAVQMARPREAESVRTATAPWRAWYKTARWQRLRWQVLVRDLFTCAMCGRVEAETRRLVADHVVPHRGDEALFWAEANLQCLCAPCHDGAKQRIERIERGGEGGVKTLQTGRR